MMKRIALVTAVASMFVLASVDAQARRGCGPGHGPHGKDGDARILRHADELGLSDAQMEQIKSIHEAAKAQSEPLRADIKQMRDEKRELMQAPVIDEVAVMGLIDEMAPIRVGLNKIRIKAHIDVLGVLTPEQREMLQQIREERRDMRDKRGAKFKAWKTDKTKAKK